MKIPPIEFEGSQLRDAVASRGLRDYCDNMEALNSLCENLLRYIKDPEYYEYIETVPRDNEGNVTYAYDKSILLDREIDPYFIEKSHKKKIWKKLGRL